MICCSVADALLLENDQQGVGSRLKEVAEGRQQEEEELIRQNLQKSPQTLVSFSSSKSKLTIPNICVIFFITLALSGRV